jgi:protein-S-isoprenylcysteine O-methyltransferase Ste14
MLEPVWFIVLSLPILYFSRRSLKDRRAHGFYRFFAWEAILALVLLNVSYWVRAPLSIHQLIAWSFLIVSLFLVIHGFQLLRKIGRPSNQTQKATNLAFENTTNLVTVGAYRYIRHPLYSSLLFLNWGVYFKHASLPALALALLASVFIYATARIEEQENKTVFGDAYTVYMKHSKMFIPYIL